MGRWAIRRRPAVAVATKGLRARAAMGQALNFKNVSSSRDVAPSRAEKKTQWNYRCCPIEDGNAHRALGTSLGSMISFTRPKSTWPPADDHKRLLFEALSLQRALNQGQ